MIMLEQLFPKTLDNRFQGHLLALWLFIPITLGKVLAGLSYLFAADVLARGPLVSANIEDVVGFSDIVAQIGLSELSLGLVFLVVLFRYRSMIPLMYTLLLVGILLEKGLMSHAYSALVSEPSNPLLTLTIALMSIVGFIFSIRSDRPLLEQLR
ncbi:MAG: hypothetical protein ACI9WC_002936 [Arenicella sp.]|jgi:hypothetical protein